MADLFFHLRLHLNESRKKRIESIIQFFHIGSAQIFQLLLWIAFEYYEAELEMAVMNFISWIVLLFMGKRWCRRAAPALKSHLARCHFSREMLKCRTKNPRYAQSACTSGLSYGHMLTQGFHGTHISTQFFTHNFHRMVPDGIVDLDQTDVIHAVVFTSHAFADHIDVKACHELF